MPIMEDDDVSPTISEETTNTATRTAANTARENHLKQKRARSQLSCTPCRQGKLKCNRQHEPACDQCIKRNRESACIFVPPPAKHKPAQNVKGRIRQLETLVVDLMNQNRGGQEVQPQANGTGGEKRRQSGSSGNALADSSRSVPYSQPTPPSDNDTSPQFTERSPEDVDSATTPFGQMKISKDEISYVGESHWGAILNSISDLKRDLGDEEEEAEGERSDEPFAGHGSARVPMGGVQPHATTGLGFMLGDATPMTKEQLIKAIPEKKVTDRLLSLWFNSPDPFKPIIHAPTFQDEYRRFWRDSKGTPTMWLGLLYAIMSLAASFGLRDTDPSSPQAQAVLADVNKYHSLAASAAVLADFTKPKEYTIECLILYAAGLRSNNAFVNVWLMIGLVVRLALRMGYHRDPSHYPKITVFQGEMRRRVWSVIGMIDVLISFQLGLPSMFKTIQSDTQPPRNLLDRDFNSSTPVLPPSRSVDELTPSSYTRAKLRIVKVFADAAELSHATVAPSHEDIMRLDRELEEAKAAIPPLLQMPDISELVTDPAEQLMCRFNLDLLYLKTKIVLHRRYMLTPTDQLTPAEQQQGIGHSRKACIECALRVLQHHHTIYTASQTGGQLESVKWYMGSISTHDFLLAAMVICLELSEQLQNRSFSMHPLGLQCPKRRAMMDALEKSHKIWSDASGRQRKAVQFTAKDGMEKGEHMFDETEKASRAMAVMLEKVKRQMGGIANATGQTPQAQVNGADAPTPITAMMQEFAAENEARDAPGQFLSQQRAFNGVISTYQWGNVDGVPEDLGTGTGQQLLFGNGTSNGSSFNPPVDFNVSTGSSNGNTSFSQAQSNNNTPPNDNQDLPDFPMIGDMLEGPMNLDWESWDNQFINADQDQTQQLPFNTDWSKETPGLAGMRYGNAMTGGTRPVVAGNAMFPNGTAPVGMDFSMDMGNLEDVDFSQMGIGGAGANMANHSWESFWTRKP
ncbi:hypothetical protein LTR37_018113 [Vermiconidia calcicola]|uniref:Uncharacterized protein n=1 Tax=Vermiconidia calcicola TaxID=1690605 RepID=A0ACC3MHY9_9PEZI|nr:hypothetical protein LTR37_018113 [Vermiconidia calcicola]